jgi:HK97 family phage major capsid protein
VNFLTQVRAQLADISTKRAALLDELEQFAADDESRADDGRVDEISAELEQIRSSEDALKAREAELVTADERRKAAAAILPAGESVVRREERTYNPDSEKRGTSFLADVIARASGDFDAGQRLSRHMAEERAERGTYLERAVGTGAFDGLVVPQYLTDLVAPLARAGRPFANICRSHTLPPAGMTVNISRITTGTSTAVQATENNAVSETNADDTLLTVPVRTIAGQQTVSRQAIDRGTGVDQVVLQDLIRAYHTALDNQIINGDGNSGAHLGIQTVSGANDITFTEAAPTAANTWPKLLDAIQRIQTGSFYGVSHFLMHPRRWWWLASNVGTNFPFIQQIASAPQTGGNVGTRAYEQGPSGVIAGVPVIVDANITTADGAAGRDVIYAVTADECHLWEDPSAPLFIRAEQTHAASLGVLMVVYGYSAFTAGRYPLALTRVRGSGLAAPTF